MAILKVANIHFNQVASSRLEYLTANVISFIANTNGVNIISTGLEPRQSNTISLGTVSKPSANVNVNKIVFGNNVTIQQVGSNLKFSGAGVGYTFDKTPNGQSFKTPTLNVYAWTAGTYTWTKPTGCRLIKVTVVGGGGGGGPAGIGDNLPSAGLIAASGGGGAGSVGIKWIDVSNWSNTTTVTVGEKGRSFVDEIWGRYGTATSFGTHVSAPGGSPGQGSNFNTTTFSYSGGFWSADALGGDASDQNPAVGGHINLYGSGGMPSWKRDAIGMGGHGGSGFGGGMTLCKAIIGGTISWATNARTHGAGGSGRIETTANNQGGNGANGLCIVEEFYY